MSQRKRENARQKSQSSIIWSWKRHSTTFVPAAFCWLEASHWSCPHLVGGITQGCEYQEMGIIGDHLRAHLPQSLFAVRDFLKQKKNEESMHFQTRHSSPQSLNFSPFSLYPTHFCNSLPFSARPYGLHSCSSHYLESSSLNNTQAPVEKTLQWPNLNTYWLVIYWAPTVC